jgi:hypothetical protein
VYMPQRRGLLRWQKQAHKNDDGKCDDHRPTARCVDTHGSVCFTQRWLGALDCFFTTNMQMSSPTRFLPAVMLHFPPAFRSASRAVPPPDKIQANIRAMKRLHTIIRGRRRACCSSSTSDVLRFVRWELATECVASSANESI